MRVLLISSHDTGAITRALPGSARCTVSPAAPTHSGSGRAWDIALLHLSSSDSLDELQSLRSQHPDLPMVIIAPEPSRELLRVALRFRVLDVLDWPAEQESLAALVEAEARHLNPGLASPGHGPATFEGLVGSSPPMRRLYRLLERVAPSDASVVVTGETGTGKELVAQAIHQRSPRRDRPFVAVNCSALPEALLESELFGHTRGAFTDARRARAGLFVRAQGGTLFLDEIAEMPPGLQPKLLRALQERTLRPVGSDDEVPFDVRVVAATNLNLEGAVAERRFRQDLFYRLAVIQVDLPPLRDRGRDIVHLAHTFMERTRERTGHGVRALTRAATQRLLDYRWPGNVRELQNCVERALALAEGEEITVDDLPGRIRTYKPSHVLVSAHHSGELVTMDEVERRYIQRVLTSVGGSRRRAATILGMDRKTLYRKLKRYDLEDQG